ncbi:MAG: OmpA family protein [Marinobacter sp.]|nr:OmpA family protein [Marinobacter sp.]
MSDLDQAASRVARRSDSLRIPLVSSAEEDSWLITYLDVITLLLVVFVVMLAFSGGPSDTPGAGEVQRVEVATVNDPLAETAVPEMTTEPVNPAAEFAGRALSFLQEAGLSEEVEVIEQEGGVSLRVSSEILFASGAATLTNQGIDQLEKLVPLLAESDYRITVAGHTDNVPVRSQRFPSNWELSSARAGSVVRLFEADGIPSSRMQATGYADTRPLARNDTERGRARNRRVELVLQPPVDNTDE